MICPRCRCEVGNQRKCPYCGTHLQKFQTYILVKSRNNKCNRLAQCGFRIQQPINHNIYQQDPIKKHVSNIDTWSLIEVVLLVGIFITSIMQLILQLAD